MNYYRKPYMSQLSRVSPLAAANEYASARSRDYHSSVADELHNATFGKKQWRRPRYFPVSVWCPSHDFNFDSMHEMRSSHRPATYIPEYEPVMRTGSYGYTPRWYSTGTTTVTRTGPYGVTRTYRY